MQILIIHGSFGDVNRNWFSWLKDELEKDGQTVFLPQFPVDDWDELTARGEGTQPQRQLLETWIDDFKENTLPQIDQSQPLGIAAHSVGPLFAAHIIGRGLVNPEWFMAVAPFTGFLPGEWQIELVNKSFYDPAPDWGKVKESATKSLVFYSDDDPYVPEKESLKFATNIGAEVKKVSGAEHFNTDAGYTKFPELLERINQINQ